MVAVAVAGNGGANREEALLEDYSFNSSNSFSPLTAESDQEVQKEAQEIQQPVSFIFLNFFSFLAFFNALKEFCAHFNMHVLFSFLCVGMILF